VNKRPKVAISVGDLNGIGIELILRNHVTISQTIEPLYCIDMPMLTQASQKLNLSIPPNFHTFDTIAPYFEIEAGVVSKASGAYAYGSFVKAVNLAKTKAVEAICTLPIHKKAWELAGVSYKGHTDALRDFFDAEAIMMLGCEKMYVALFSEHIPLKEVAQTLTTDDLTRFLVDFYHSAKPTQKIALLGLNPHAGDDGVLGKEETIIKEATQQAHAILGKEIYTAPLVPDIAFTPKVRNNYTYYVAMYHDQGLAPLKALYFEEGINVSLNLPILRTSVDHGTAFDIAYRDKEISSLSYLNAIGYLHSHLGG